MLRAALYARYSSDLQSPSSIGDQLAACRALAARLGATVVVEHSDAAISGASVAGRPGLASLLADAKAGRLDVVIAEALDRLTRSGGDAWDIFDDLALAGVRIHTLSEGDVGEIHVGLKGTMNALFLKDLGHKVRRGLAGVVATGRHPSRPPYGYRMKRLYDAASGERIKGVLEIHAAEAAIVRRVAAEVAGGSTAHAVVLRLNAEGVPGPRGGRWEVSAIGHGGAQLRGLLRNPIYAGEIVWNRTTQPKDRRSGQTRVRQNKPEAFVRHAAPELRIVDAEIWAQAQAALAVRADRARVAGNLSGANAPRRLLSGLVRCGLCGGGMHASGPNRAYRCLARGRQGPLACANGTGARQDEVEAQVLEALRSDLLHPEVVEAFVREYRQARAQRDGAVRAQRAGLERELAESRARAGRLVDQLADGLIAGPTISGRLAELEARNAQLEAELAGAAAQADVVALHPQAARRYRQLVEDLRDALAAAGDARPASAELDQARAALRRVVTAVRIFPAQLSAGVRASANAPRAWTLKLDGDLTALLESAAAEGLTRARR